MLTEEERKSLLDKLDAVKKEADNLRTLLNQINDQKEDWFRKKEDAGKKIRELIAKVKDAKTKRNELTNTVKVDKDKRQKLHDVIVTKVEEIKKLNSEKDATIKKGKPLASVHALTEQIEKLQRKIETEVMSFDKEKELMKKIKELKKQKLESAALNGTFDDSRKLSKEIDKMKKEANIVHKTIQDNAKNSQTQHETILETSKQIDVLKVEEEEAYKKFFEFKQQFTDANNKLKEKLIDLNELYQKLGKEKEEKKEERKQQRRKTLRQKEHEVNEKIRKGEKLTTDDLLVLQGADMENNNNN